jgi:carboxypeptidase family protein
MDSFSPTARLFALVILLTLFNAAIATSQVVTGAILGRVTDTTGAVVPGATVQIQNVDTGFSRTEQTDSEGRYLSRSLPLGSYSVTVQQSGFQSQVRRGIILTVASEVTVNVELAVGNVQEQVEVTAEAPLVETTNATVSSLVSQAEIRDLPLNGRSIDSLALLSPGSLQNRAISNSPVQGMGLRLSVNGGRPDSNVFLLDGTVVNDYTGLGFGGAAGVALGVEGVQEFRLLTHSVSAEYGRNAGGVMSMVTRSGTNELHGSAYEFVRNNIFDARNFFNPGALPPFRRNQFGAAAGGRIIKDRLFFFANYEGLRQRKGNTLIATVPDVNARKGLVPVTIGGVKTLTQVPVSPVAVPYINLYPLPNGRNFGDGTAEYLSSPSSPTTEDYTMMRMDYHLSDKDNLYWRYIFDPSESLTPLAVPPFASTNNQTNHFVTLSETHIFSGSSLNEFRFGFNRTTPASFDGPTSSLSPSLDFVPGQGIGQIIFGGGQSSGGNAGLSNISSSRSAQYFISNLFQATETFSTVRGSHSLKFGVDFERVQLNIRTGSPRGEFRFGGLSDLLAAGTCTSGAPYPAVGGVCVPTRSDITLLSATSSDIRGWRRRMFGWFVQDDFRLRPNLTLNLGVRHEFFTDPTEVNGKIGNLINPSDTHFTPGKAFSTNKLSFSPRFGLAWDPKGNGKTSVRLGGGIYYAFLDGRNWSRDAQLDSDYVTNVTVLNPPFPNPLANGFSLTSQAVSSFQPELDTPTVIQYNLEVQRQVAQSVSVRAAYVGSYGYNMMRLAQLNLRFPTILADGTQLFPASGPLRNPSFSDIGRMLSDANYNYNGLQAAVQKSVSSGLRIQASYTYSKAMSNNDQVIQSQSTAAPVNGPDPNNLAAEYSLSSYDQRHTLVLNGSYDMPWEKRLTGGVAKSILGGWGINGIFSYGSGYPLSISNTTNTSRTGTPILNDRPNLVAGASNNPIHGVTAGCQGVAAGQKLHTPDRWYDPCAFVLATPGTFGNLGRNTVTAPGGGRVDFTIRKTTALTEKKKLEFRAEFFNLFNHALFQIPTRQIFTSTGAHSGNEGRITATATDNRQIEFGMKLTF